MVPCGSGAVNIGVEGLLIKAVELYGLPLVLVTQLNSYKRRYLLSLAILLSNYQKEWKSSLANDNCLA